MSTQDIRNAETILKKEKILTKLPAKEIIWVKSISQTGKIFYTTSNPERTQYYLYEKTMDGFLRIAKSSSPVNFNQMIDAVEEPKPAKKIRKTKKT